MYQRYYAEDPLYSIVSLQASYLNCVDAQRIDQREASENLIQIIKANRSSQASSSAGRHGDDPSKSKKVKVDGPRAVKSSDPHQSNLENLVALRRELIYQPLVHVRSLQQYTAFLRNLKQTFKSTGAVKLPVGIQYDTMVRKWRITTMDERDGYSSDWLFSLERKAAQDFLPGDEKLYCGEERSLEITAELEVQESAHEENDPNTVRIELSQRYYNIDTLPYHFILRTKILILPNFYRQLYPETLLQGRSAFLGEAFQNAKSQDSQAFFGMLSRENGKKYPNEPSPELLYASLSPAQDFVKPSDLITDQALPKDPKGKGKARAQEDEMDWQSTLALRSKFSPVGLLPNLLPFQSRSLGWLLRREGKQAQVDEYDEEGQHVLIDCEAITDADVKRGPFWQIVFLQGSPDQPLWYNSVTSEVSIEDPLENQYNPFNSRPGSMLCDEMGTGKTVSDYFKLILYCYLKVLTD